MRGWIGTERGEQTAPSGGRPNLTGKRTECLTAGQLQVAPRGRFTSGGNIIRRAETKGIPVIHPKVVTAGGRTNSPAARETAISNMNANATQAPTSSSVLGRDRGPGLAYAFARVSPNNATAVGIVKRSALHCCRRDAIPSSFQAALKNERYKAKASIRSKRRSNVRRIRLATT